MRPLIVANWKMNPASQKKAKQLFNSLKQGLKNNRKAEVVICPPFIYLSTIHYPLSTIKLGVQNCFWEKEGAFTGEISPSMLRDLKVKYVILGHSERRRIFGETDEMINKKLKAVLKEKLTPILCVGETQSEKDAGKTFQIIENQLKQDLKKVPSSKFQTPGLCIAYEPIWAIGSGHSCYPDDALTVALFIKKVIAENFSKKAARNIKVLYGGSVNAENAKSYLSQEGIDGLLVGGASLRPKEFLKIIHLVQKRES